MTLNLKTFVFFALVSAIGGLIGLLIWTLIVKGQVSSTISGAVSSNPVTGALASLFGSKTS